MAKTDYFIPDLPIAKAMTVLPRFVVMQVNSQGGYLGVKEPMDVMSFDVKEIFSPRVKFAMEKSASGDPTLVHIRCCYNNKYWEVRDIEGRPWICASADKRQEDPTKPACTLFKPILGSEAQTLSFLCIAKNMEVVSKENGLELGVDATLFHTVDWETLVILPSLVAFKSKELDGYYLCSRELEGNHHLRFESGVDIGDPVVAHELFPTPDGNYRIKNINSGKFIRRSGDGDQFVLADAEEGDNSNDTLFSVVKISDHVFALRNLGNNNFCGAHTTKDEGPLEKCLAANYPTISRQTKLMVEECVLEREIFDLQYRLSDSRIYDEEIQEVSHAFATNHSPDNEAKITLKFSSSDTSTSTWTSTESTNLDANVKFETNMIPFIGNIDVKVHYEALSAHHWGATETRVSKREASYVAVVPPSTTMKVVLLFTKAACDVPFSFTQRDLLTNGERVTTIKDDGIFTGICSYNFCFDSSNEGEPSVGKIYM